MCTHWPTVTGVETVVVALLTQNSIEPARQSRPYPSLRAALELLRTIASPSARPDAPGFTHASTVSALGRSAALSGTCTEPLVPSKEAAVSAPLIAPVAPSVTLPW